MLQERLKGTNALVDQQMEKLRNCELNCRTDALTELTTRRVFDEELLRRFHEFQRTGGPFVLIVLEVDLFSRFRNVHGQPAADAVLRGIASILRQKMRNMDLVARYGDEQFAIILPATTAQGAYPVAERTRRAIEQGTFRQGETQLAATASLGVAECLPTENLLCLVRRVEEALRQAQLGGRNATCCHGDTKIQRACDATGSPASRQVLAGTGPQSAPHQTADREPSLVPANRHGKFSASLTQLSAQTGDATLLRWYIEKRMGEWKRTEAPFSVIMWQLDKQSELASMYGRHTCELMARIALRTITASVRDMDVASQCDSNTYALLLPLTSLESAREVSERVLKSLRECRFPVGKAHVPCTLSIGVVEVAFGDDMGRLLQRAEAAMLAAVEAGGDGVRCLKAAPPETVRTAVEPKRAELSPTAELCV